MMIFQFSFFIYCFYFFSFVIYETVCLGVTGVLLEMTFDWLESIVFLLNIECTEPENYRG